LIRTTADFADTMRQEMLDFSEIYDEQLPRVYGFVAYRVTGRADAEDLTQQTFERALRSWAEFDSGRAAITTWLLSIARNLIIDHYRAAAHRTRSVAIEAVPESSLPRGGGDSPNLGVSPELQAALAELADRERELVALRYGADLSCGHIAEVSELSVANVQQILSRALRKLRDSLEQHSPDVLRDGTVT
jgi:RNA polymerase sigma-70 factor (ECF subfamily)